MDCYSLFYFSTFFKLTKQLNTFHKTPYISLHINICKSVLQVVMMRCGRSGPSKQELFWDQLCKRLFEYWLCCNILGDLISIDWSIELIWIYVIWLFYSLIINCQLTEHSFIDLISVFNSSYSWHCTWTKLFFLLWKLDLLGLSTKCCCNSCNSWCDSLIHVIHDVIHTNKTRIYLN